MPKEIEILTDAKTCQSDASKNSSFNNTDIFSVFYWLSFQSLHKSHMGLVVQELSSIWKKGKIKSKSHTLGDFIGFFYNKSGSSNVSSNKPQQNSQIKLY